MGTLHNRAGGRIESGGTLSSMGSVRNAGTLHADAAMSLMGALTNEHGARISSYGRINQMGHVNNAGELVQFAPRPTVTPVEDKPASTAPVGVAGNHVGGSEGRRRLWRSLSRRPRRSSRRASRVCLNFRRRS